MKHLVRTLLPAALLWGGGLWAAPGAEPDAPPPAGWASEVSAGFNLTSGNSETTLLDLGASTDYRAPGREIAATVSYAYGESGSPNDDVRRLDEKTTDNAVARFQYNRLFDELRYAYGKAEARYDDIADIDYRATGGAGLGAYLLKSGTTRLAVELGLGYLAEKVGGVTDAAPVLQATQRFEHRLSETAKLFEELAYQPHLDAFSQYLLNVEVGADAALNHHLVLRVKATDRYDNDPAPGKKHNALALTAALVYSF